MRKSLPAEISKRNKHKLYLQRQFKYLIGLYWDFCEEKSFENDKRLDQYYEILWNFEKLGWLFKRIWALEQREYLRSKKPLRKSHKATIKRQGETSIEEIILTEAFYYISWRCVSVLSHVFPKLKGRVKGVDMVRNKLIEHPYDLSSGIFDTSYAIAVPGGPKIKALRFRSKKMNHIDRGLWVNFDEFMVQTIKVLSKRLNEPVNPFSEHI